MILAGDVGGTKTLLGVFETTDARPHVVATFVYATTAYDSFTAMLDEFERSIGQRLEVDAAVAGVAGPVVANRARLTNIDWDIAAADISARVGTRRVQLINDLEATATSVNALGPDELHVLYEGSPRADGNAAVLAAGTGLGQAFLHRVGGRLRPVPSEGGHADFAARTDREIELLRMLREQYGRAEVEQVLSGQGLINLHRFTHRGGECEMLGSVPDADLPPRITQAGMSGRCQHCAEVVQMFVSAYGAEAGNLALRGVTTSGVYIGGGIAPKILPALQSGAFMDAFLAKDPMRDLLEKVPVKVILNQEAALLGAALHAQELAKRPA